jgi:hypothetical protein
VASGLEVSVEIIVSDVIDDSEGVLEFEVDKVGVDKFVLAVGMVAVV